MTRAGAASGAGPGGGGSRFLYDSFDAAHARIEANERVAEQRWAALEYRLGQIETTLERLEKRIWLGVYGVAAFLLAQGAEAVLRAAMRG
ncbi:GTA head formation protein, RCAP_rcc01685 family [Gemmobacter serpentinus]|uniref:GTA head formation protein, RCAP_rcc01685 family n=1 Tax=Gemmobacter serpentinus TaxID=2652247 RepID=UPI00124E54C2|nr:hypothetical protein [Gemmobacter serpentinus]